jgi:hypothetical protein
MCIQNSARAKQESIIHALPVPNITQKLINIFRRYFEIPYDAYSLVVLRGFSGVVEIV